MLLNDPLAYKDFGSKELKTLVYQASKFLILDGSLMRRDRQGQHKVVPDPTRRLGLLRKAHDDLGHRGIFTTFINIKERFWWPMINTDVHWFVSTCHTCQTRQLVKVRIPPVVTDIPTLFRKVHINCMLMPVLNRKRYIVHARCALTSWPEWRSLRQEIDRSLSTFIFEEILCRWGGIAEIVTDNGPAFVKAADTLARRYGIWHIKISAYNKQANGLVERKHYDVCEAVMRTCGNQESQWTNVLPQVFWAEWVTIRKSLGFSPFYMTHGVEAILPFDIAKATYLLPPLTVPTSTESLIAYRTRQLQKRPEDLADMALHIMEIRETSVAQYIHRHQHTIKDHVFEEGALVLVRNTRVEMELNRKTKLQGLGPMAVLRRTKGGAYILSESDGAVAKMRYAAFRLIPYLSRNTAHADVTTLLTPEDVDLIQDEANTYPLAGEAEDGHHFDPEEEED
jgi:hypothetical protein